MTGLWLLPLRDALSFAVFLGSFCGRNVSWRDQRLRVGNRCLGRDDLEVGPPLTRSSGLLRLLQGNPILTDSYVITFPFFISRFTSRAVAIVSAESTSATVCQLAASDSQPGEDSHQPLDLAPGEKLRVPVVGRR